MMQALLHSQQGLTLAGLEGAIFLGFLFFLKVAMAAC
jgi:hypothetical protein